jgi:hypothetical protein
MGQKSTSLASSVLQTQALLLAAKISRLLRISTPDPAQSTNADFLHCSFQMQASTSLASSGLYVLLTSASTSPSQLQTFFTARFRCQPSTLLVPFRLSSLLLSDAGVHLACSFQMPSMLNSVERNLPIRVEQLNHVQE